MKSRRFLQSISIVAILSLLVFAVLYFVPRVTPFNLCFDAAQVDINGNDIGTAQITIHGNKLDYLFQKDRLDIDIVPFANFSSFSLSEDAQSGKEGIIRQHSDDLMEVTLYTVSSQSGQIIFCNLYFTEDFEYLAFSFVGAEENYWYVASCSGNLATDEIAQQFKGLVPGYRSS